MSEQTPLINISIESMINNYNAIIRLTNENFQLRDALSEARRIINEMQETKNNEPEVT